MIYEIIPLELGSIVEREIYRNGHQTLLLDLIWGQISRLQAFALLLSFGLSLSIRRAKTERLYRLPYQSPVSGSFS